MVKKYRVTFLGPLNGLDCFREKMHGLGFESGIVELIVQKAPVVVKRDMTLRDARELAESIQFAGGKVNIQDDGISEDFPGSHRSPDVKPLDHFTMCPECGHKQPKSSFCVKCGRPFRAQIQGGFGENDRRC